MSHIANKIIAQDKALNSIFSETRYRIDSFQREYRWQHKQIDALISDISSSFLLILLRMEDIHCKEVVCLSPLTLHSSTLFVVL